MKPAPFAYSAPTSIDEAVSLLAEDDGARVLAGGQSLVPTMNFRLARPTRLVDINRIPGLDYVRTENGALRIGALARHRAFETPVAGGALGRLLPVVARHIAHVPIRARGTFCGSLAHADPASEWCTLALVANAEIVARGPQGERVIAAGDFFDTVFTTTLAPGEMICESRLPLPDEGWSAGFAEFARRAGDYAIVMAAAIVNISEGRICEARIGLGNVIDRPVRALAAEAVLAGRKADDAAFREAGERAAQSIEPYEDMHSDAAYKRDLIRAMVRRALAHAVAQ
jgi:carbon-monoxide dehydrogenase medium subunit